MGRFAFAILLIANLLVCPLRCFSCQAGVAVDDDCVQAACCCCHDAKEGEGSSSDEPSSDDECSCPDCICEGATIQADPEIPGADSFVALGPWVVPSDELLLEGTPSLRVATRDRPPSFPGGRDALVAFQIWLI